MKTKMAVALTVSACALAGCAGARTSVVANGAAYPVSMSPAVRNADGSLVARGQRRVVAKFESDSTAWGMFYSAIKLDPRTDLSRAINRQVHKAHGDAIVNLRVATSYCPLDFFPLLNWLPIWPGCTNVRVQGDIVRVTPPPRPGSFVASSVVSAAPRSEAPLP